MVADVERLVRFRWLLFAVLGLDGALLSFHYVWSATLSKHLVMAWDLDASQLGLLAALGVLPYALMQIPGGLATDRLGGRRMLTTALAVTAIGTALFAVAPTLSVAFIARIVIGAGSAVILLPTLTVMAQWFRTREYATAQGAMMLISAIGSAMGTVPLAVAAERWSWRAPMLAVAMMTAVGAALSWWVVRDRPSDLGFPTIASIDPDWKGGEDARARHSFRESLRDWRTRPTLWVSSLILFASGGALQAYQGLWAGPMLRHIRGFSANEVGQALLMFTIGVGFGPILFGWLSDQVVRRRKPVVVAATISQAFLWLLVVMATDRLPVSVLYLVFLGLAALSGGVLITQVMVKEACRPGTFGTIFGIINGITFYGTVIIQLVAGGILNAVGPESIRDEPIYSAQAYSLALSPIVILMTIAACFSLRLRETLSGPHVVVSERSEGAPGRA